VRKIISILLALGVILGLSLMAAPVAAAPVCPTDCTLTVTDLLGPPSFCAGGTSNYNITGIALPVTLIPGTDSLSVDFPAGTDLTAVVKAGVIVTKGVTSYSPAAITGNTAGSTHLEFVIPAGFMPNLFALGDVITIQVNGVVNPSTAGKACLFVDYKFACCPAQQFNCQQITISPAVATLGFHFNFGPTYTGIALDCIPPFKACGQEGFGTQGTVGWLTNFNITLTEDVPGCHVPCTTATMWFVLTKAPTGEIVTFSFSGVNYTLVATGVAATTDVGKKYVLFASNLSLTDTWVDKVWPSSLHFSSPGDYEICFYLQCPAGTSCPDCGPAAIKAQKCLPATVYQWKDAYKISLGQKWNLISLPLFPFNTKIESVLGCMGGLSQLQSVWYFGQCEDPAADKGTWHTEYYNPTTKTFSGNLADIVAGKAYWVRMLEPGETGYSAGAFPATLWVFGNHAPMPPSSPMGYFDVCKGWNMVGFKAPWLANPGPGLSPQNEMDNLYLWNFNKATMDTVHYGLIYQWVGWPTQDWAAYAPGALNMTPGQGYWIPFDGDGEIYPSP
jgi:hypothetical protein